MTFAQPALLWLVPVVIGIIGLGALRYTRRRRRLGDLLGGPEAARRLTAVNLYRPPYGRLALLAAAGGLMAFGLAEPRSRNAGLLTPGEPWEVLLALDISRSMQATDIAPTRLAEAREVLHELLDPLRSQRVGILLFAGESYLVSPPTLDHDVLRFFIDGIDPELVSESDEGTDLVAALARARTIFENQTRPAGGRALVVLSDGDLQEDAGVVDSVRALAGRGVRTFTIGIGTTEGTGLSVPHRPGRWGGPLLHEDGTPVISRLNETLLQQIARAGNGRYASASSAMDLRQQARALAALPEGGAQARGGWLRGHDAVFWVAFLALLMLLLESMLHNRWRVPRLYRAVFRPLSGTLRGT